MADHRALATDAVVLLDGAVLMIERDHDPQAGSWVLPGGMVDPGERARAACVREVREEARQIGTFDPDDLPGNVGFDHADIVEAATVASTTR